MFHELFDQVPVSGTAADHWAVQDQGVLDSVAQILVNHGAEPWVFGADARHFWQFATAADVAAMHAMSMDQFHAVFGEWDEDDHDPETFGYLCPRV